MSVLILTMPGDYHAHAVRWAVGRLGGDARVLYPMDLCAGGQWTFAPDGDSLLIDGNGERQSLSRADYRTLWVRRPGSVFPLDKIADTAERAVAEDELRAFISGVVNWLEVGKFVVNPSAATVIAGNKTYQFALAESLGLTGAKTLVSNSPRDILAFFDACGGEFVFKPLRPALWTISETQKSIVPTTLITDRSLLTGSDLSSAPGIYQEKIVKQGEIRATFMGRSVFCWEKRFDRRPHEELEIDWRGMYKDCDHRQHELPADIVDKCHRLMKVLGLVYGAFDFALDADGSYHFLEVNPQGQFLWGDQVGVGLNQLEAFAEFLLARDPDFRYSNAGRFTLQDYDAEDLYQAAQEAETRDHYGNVTTFNYKQVAVAF